MLKSKIHRATVTDSNLNYEGSLTVDGLLMKEVDLSPFERISVYNINNGERFETYVIEGEAGSGVIAPERRRRPKRSCRRPHHHRQLCNVFT